MILRANRSRGQITGFFLLALGHLMFFAVRAQNPHSTNETLIESVTLSDQVTSKFIYNSKAQLVEEQSTGGWSKFYYDARGRLLKKEFAMDPQNLSGSRPLQAKTTLYTSEHSGPTAYYLYEYEADKLATVKHYFQINGQFEYRSQSKLEYKGSLVIKKSSLSPDGQTFSFNTYDYDGNQNVICEKYYTCDTKFAVPKLISETYYTYDNKKNPYRVHSIFFETVYDINFNNIVESRFVLVENKTGVSKEIVKIYKHQYNADSLPVSEQNQEGTLWKYHYKK